MHKVTIREIIFPSPSLWRVYSIQHYVIKFVSVLMQVCSFLRVLWFPPPIIKTDRHYITEILLKVALNIIISRMHPPIKLTTSNTLIIKIYSIHRQFVHEINLQRRITFRRPSKESLLIWAWDFITFWLFHDISILAWRIT